MRQMTDYTAFPSYPDWAPYHRDDTNRPQALVTDGPWDAEPDFVRWRFTPDLEGCAARHPGFGSWNGYVRTAARVDGDGFYVHGGVTHTQNLPDGGAVYGFDCAHAWDVSPNLPSFGPSVVYRDLPYVRAEVWGLALQCVLGGARDVPENGNYLARAVAEVRDAGRVFAFDIGRWSYVRAPAPLAGMLFAWVVKNDTTAALVAADYAEEHPHCFDDGGDPPPVPAAAAADWAARLRRAAGGELLTEE